MKYAIVVLAGAAGSASARLGGKTPLAAARKDALDALARAGRVGVARFTRPGAHAGSERALLALLGCDPDEHPIARGPLEALGAGVPLTPDDFAASGSLVTIVDDRVVDLTAGRISSIEARALLDVIAAGATSAGDASLRFAHLNRHRFVVVVSGGRTLEIATDPPHAARTQSARLAYPRGKDAARFERVLDQAAEALRLHDVNRVRIDLGENPANGAWLWGAGADRPIPSFERTFFLRAGAVAGAPLARGVATKLGLSRIEVPGNPGATGDVDTDLDAKARAASEALDTHDLVFVHVQAPRETQHAESVERTVESIESIDARLIAPLATALARFPRWRILVASDHGAPDDPGLAPFLVAGDAIQAVRGWPFDEEHATKSEFRVEEGAKLCEWFIG